MLKLFILLHKLRRNVYRDPCQLEASRLRSLRKLLIHAYNNTVHYKEVFDEKGFNPCQFENVNELTKLPVLKKNEIQSNYNSLISCIHNKRNLKSHNTSGSTGVPLNILVDNKSESYNRALKYRAFVENGFSFRDVVVEVTSPEHVNFGKFWFQKFGLFRRHKLSILDDHEKLFADINKIKPDIIECYPSVLNLITTNCKKADLSFRPKIIFTTAELLLPAWRKSISEFFECDVIDVYGSAEFYRLAWECEKHEGYHLDTDTHIIEFLDSDNNPVHEGEGFVVVTSLYNYAFPLIRYKMGDIAKVKTAPCSCGRSFPLIDSIQGREDDYIKLPSGKTISPRKINLMDFVKGIKQYKTIQLKKDLIKVQVIKNDDFNERTIESIKKQILIGCLGESITVDVELVDKIKNNTGKIRTVCSLVKKECP